jgi:hypothetical protein
VIQSTTAMERRKAERWPTGALCEPQPSRPRGCSWPGGIADPNSGGREAAADLPRYTGALAAPRDQLIVMADNGTPEREIGHYAAEQPCVLAARPYGRDERGRFGNLADRPLA